METVSQMTIREFSPQFPYHIQFRGYDDWNRPGWYTEEAWDNLPDARKSFEHHQAKGGLIWRLVKIDIQTLAE